MSDKYIITRENYDLDLIRISNQLAVDAANKIADRGCLVSMGECSKCAHSESCNIRQFRLACLNAVTVAVCSVSDYYEKL